MRWTLWSILVVLCGIYENLIGTSDKTSIGIIFVLSVSGLALMLDYFKKRK